MELTASEQERYGGYTGAPEFAEGFADYQARRSHDRHGGVAAQAYDRGAGVASATAHRGRSPGSSKDLILRTQKQCEELEYQNWDDQRDRYRRSHTSMWLQRRERLRRPHGRRSSASWRRANPTTAAITEPHGRVTGVVPTTPATLTTTDIRSVHYAWR
jgi:hypothetical protein